MLVSASTMSSSPNEPRDRRQIPLEVIASITNNFGDENLIHKGEFVNVYKGKHLRSGQLGNIVVRRRLDRVYKPREDELWMQVLKISGFQQDGGKNNISVVGFCDQNIIVYKHAPLSKYLSDKTFNWMERLGVCIIRASDFLISSSSDMRSCKEYLELLYTLSLGDLLFQVLCKKRAEEHATPMAIEHYEKGELEMIMDPSLRVQMNQESFTIFSKSAYNCIKQPSCINILDIQKGLQEALELQIEHEEYLGALFFPSNLGTKIFELSVDSLRKKLDDLQIPFNEISSATNNLGNQNLICNDRFVNISRYYSIFYKGKPSRSGQLGNIVVQRLHQASIKEPKDELWMQVLYVSRDKYLNTIIPFVGSCNHKNIIVYEHVGNGSLKKDLSDPTFNWMERLDTCIDLASRLIIFGGRMICFSSMFDGKYWEPRVSATTNSSVQRYKEHLERVCMISLGDLMFEVLCGKKAEEHAITRMAIEHYEKGELEKIIHPNLKLQMHQESFTIFSQTAYNCIMQPSINNILDIQKGLQEALELQRKHENYLKLFKIQLSNIVSSTNNFAKENEIGSGTYGTVYKAKLDHFDKRSSSIVRDNIVAIKRIFKREDEQGDQGFLRELNMLSCENPNIISLLGFCHEGSERILVYEYALQQSLDQHLGSTDKNTILTWAQRIQICLDIAQGLKYLHNKEDDKPMIIHRDIKSDNILLGKKWNAKIADFGLAKYHPVNQHASTINASTIAGTSVYLDPEYNRTGKLKKESDIYSFGVVLFEILSGKLSYDPIYLEENGNGLAPIARQHFSEGRLKEMVDPQMMEADELISTMYYGPNEDSLDTFANIAYQCLAKAQAMRQKIEVIIVELHKALNFQKNRKDTLKIPREDIVLDREVYENVYYGEFLYNDKPKDVVVKRLMRSKKMDFLSELEILLKYKHENVIDLVGYCMEKNEKLIVYEHASNGSLDMHLRNVSLGWTERLQICIDVASALDFLHEGGQTQEAVMDMDIKSASILLNGDWRARISDFGHSIVFRIEEDMDDGIKDIFSEYKKRDIYSIGVVLVEILCGKLMMEDNNSEYQFLNVVRNCFEERRTDEIVFKGINHQILPQSLATFLKIAERCLQQQWHKRPTASEVVKQLNEALEFQDIDRMALSRTYGEDVMTHSRVDSALWEEATGERKKDQVDDFGAATDSELVLTGSTSSTGASGASSSTNQVQALQTQIKELRQRNEAHDAKMRAKLEALRAQEEALEKELRAREEAHKQELRAREEAHKQELQARKEAWEQETRAEREAHLTRENDLQAQVEKLQYMLAIMPHRPLFPPPPSS